MSNKLKLGLIGIGRLGSIHAKNIAESRDGELFAICDTDEQTLAEAGRQFGAKTYSNLAEFLALPLDGVVIASSTSQHLEHVAATARAGKAIFTEKPIGLTLEETDATLQDVVNAGVKFQIGFQRRWDPRFLEAKRLIDSGEIGQPVLFKAYGRDPNASNPANWGLDKNGGLFLNAAIHDYDAARFLMGREVTMLSATGGTLVHHGLTNVGDVDTCSTTLFLTDNAMAITEWSRYATYGYDIAAEIVCEKGLIHIGNGRESGLTVLRQSDASPTVFSVFNDAYKAEIEAFICSIKEDLPTSPGVEDARISLQIALAARESCAASTNIATIPALEPLMPQ